MIAGPNADILPGAICYELCAYPPSLFESRHAILVAIKPVLETATRDLSLPDHNGPNGDVRYVLDGGTLNCYVTYSKKY